MSAASALKAAPSAEPFSFEALYGEAFDLVWRTLGRLGVPPGSLDDACQEVFLLVHRRRDQFRGQSTLKTWVVGIAIRVAAKHRRTARRKPDAQPIDAQVPDPSLTPLERASQEQERALVYRLFEQLPEEHREVLVLTEMEQMTGPEVSEALGLNLNTVYSRLRLARHAFDAALEAWHTGALK